MLSVAQGTCYSIFVYDIAFSIDLNAAERHITSATRETLKHKRPAPRYFEYRPAPLRILRSTEPVKINEAVSAEGQVELVLYDFGAVTVIYRVPLNERSNLLSLSQQLYDNKSLLDDSLR